MAKNVVHGVGGGQKKSSGHSRAVAKERGCAGGSTLGKGEGPHNWTRAAAQGERLMYIRSVHPISIQIKSVAESKGVGVTAFTRYLDLNGPPARRLD